MITKTIKIKSNFNRHEPTMTKTSFSFQLKHETKDKSKECAKNVGSNKILLCKHEKKIIT